MTQSSPLSIGIIGTGFGATIAEVFHLLAPSARIRLCGADTGKSAEIAKRLKLHGSVDDWRELIVDPELNLIVIASPNFLHRSMFELAAAHHKHVLLEKPSAPTSIDAEAMIQTSLGSDALVVINHEARCHPVTKQLRNYVSSGALGTILTLRVGAYLNFFSRPDYTGWWYNEKSKGGGQVHALGTHQLDLARFLLGMPELISGSLQTSCFQDARFDRTVDAESQFCAHFMSADGTSIQLFNDTYCHGYKDFLIEIYGSRGVARYSDIEGLRVSMSNSEPLLQVETVDPLPEIKTGNSFLSRSLKYLLSDLISTLESGQPNPSFCTLAQSRDNLRYFEQFSAPPMQVADGFR